MNLNKYREQIDNCDKEILKLLEKRFLISKLIGEYKRKEGLKVYDKKRETEILNKRVNESSLNKKFVFKFFRLLFKESKRLQK
jgi:chorismate mutase